MNLYPIMVNLHDRQVVIVGGGGVALRKARDLIEADALVRVIAPEVHEEIRALADRHPGRISLAERPYADGDLAGAMLVFSATSNPAVNRGVFEEASRRGLFINAVDDPPNCSFFLSSMVRRGDLVMTISTSGASPAMAARLRRELARHIPEDIETVLAALSRARDLLKDDPAFAALNTHERGALLKRIVADDSLLHKLCAADRQHCLSALLQDIA